jgi:hypothetical protein
MHSINENSDRNVLRVAPLQFRCKNPCLKCIEGDSRCSSAVKIPVEVHRGRLSLQFSCKDSC